MAVIRLTDNVHAEVQRHLFSEPGEHFGFILADWGWGPAGPVFLASEFHRIEDDQVSFSDGYEVSAEAIIGAVNAAVRRKKALIEVHNHPAGWPRFSRTDREGFDHFVPYALDSLPGRPYAATVWTEQGLHGEYFLDDCSSGPVRGITVVGERLMPLVAHDPTVALEPRFARQESWFTRRGQTALGSLRAGVVGLGGTGSQMVQNLVYLGVRDFVLVDDDLADETSMNRLVTAEAADIGSPKVILGRRLIRSVAPGARVTAIEAQVQSSAALSELKGVDVLFGCVDNDGARLVLNELALAYLVPLVDLGVGVDAPRGKIRSAGGRVAIVMPGGPCLWCLGEIDQDEARHFLASHEERARQVELGYLNGIDEPAPAVVSLNATVAACAATEFAVLVSGARPRNTYTEVDLLGNGRRMASQWITPRRVDAQDGCVQCGLTGRGDLAQIDRYAVRPV